MRSALHEFLVSARAPRGKLCLCPTQHIILAASLLLLQAAHHIVSRTRIVHLLYLLVFHSLRSTCPPLAGVQVCICVQAPTYMCICMYVYTGTSENSVLKIFSRSAAPPSAAERGVIFWEFRLFVWNQEPWRCFPWTRAIGGDAVKVVCSEMFSFFSTCSEMFSFFFLLAPKCFLFLLSPKCHIGAFGI